MALSRKIPSILPKNTDTPAQRYIKIVKAQQSGERKWKIFTALSFGCLVAAIAALIWALTLPKTVPMVITVSDWGEAKYVGNVSSYSYNGLKVPPVAIEYQLRKFVDHMFAIPSDSSILRTNLEDCYASLTNDAANKFTDTIRADNPKDHFGKMTRTVEIETILKLSDKSYQLDFFLDSTAGTTKTRQRMRGVISTELLEPSESDQIRNPLGIYITNFDYTNLVTQ